MAAEKRSIPFILPGPNILSGYRLTAAGNCIPLNMLNPKINKKKKISCTTVIVMDLTRK